ncbi:SagB/ThcOx family dehydrogenase [Nonomuraea sp. NPDC049725]|uniref:SagB/ThcOx family dehydrogenase n=1 Tax=Nonomuraea sp. NPDC049725 TaxID=3154508 RepID=UPI00341AB987
MTDRVIDDVDIVPGTRISMLDGELTVANPETGRRFRVSAPAAHALLDDMVPDGLRPLGERPRDARTRAGVDHWVARGWDLCLDYYLASRGIVYADRADADDSVRRGLMERAVADEPVPARKDVPGDRIGLPPAGPLPARGLGEVLLGRRSVRRYRTGATTADQVSQLLHHGLEPVRRLRDAVNTPLDLLLKSFGSAFDVYVACYDVNGIERGVHYYDLAAHALVRLSEIPELEQEDWFWGMPGPRTAAGTVVLVADFAQCSYRYPHERALRDLYLEAGRIAQRLIVMAGYAGLGTVVTPAVRDTLVNARFGLDPAREAVVYTVTFGVDGRQ